MRYKKYGIRKHFAWLTMTPLLVMVITMEAFFLSDRADNMDQDLITRGRLIASQLAASSEYGLFSNNHNFLKDIAERAIHQADVRSVIILNDSHVMAAAGMLPNVWLATATMSPKIAYQNKLTGGLSPQLLLKIVNENNTLVDTGETILLYQPILSTQIPLSDFDQPPSASRLGAVVIEMDWQHTHQMQSRMLWLSIAASALFLLLTLYLIYLASRRIIDPIRQLNTAIQAIGAGNLDTRVSEPIGINELYNLSQGINKMTAELQHERSILQHRIDKATIQLRNLAFYDTLTDLPNRRLLSERLAHALSASKRSRKYGALIFLDLDNFKPVNDLHGHAAGDQLLIETAQRLNNCVREIDTVARYGGDEFVIVIGELDARMEEAARLAYLVAENIRNRLGEDYQLTIQKEGQPDRNVMHRCSSSIGVTMFLDHHASQDEIMSWADSAMYRSKQAGRNRITFYHPEERPILPDAQP